MATKINQTKENVKKNTLARKVGSSIKKAIKSKLTLI
jgi:hypothetical protein